MAIDWGRFTPAARRRFKMLANIPFFRDAFDDDRRWRLEGALVRFTDADPEVLRGVGIQTGSSAVTRNAMGDFTLTWDVDVAARLVSINPSGDAPRLICIDGLSGTQTRFRFNIASSGLLTPGPPALGIVAIVFDHPT